MLSRRVALICLANAAALALPLSAALAQQAPSPTPPPPPASATVRVVLTTSEGPVTVEVEKDKAPITAANFLRYVDQKRLDGATFYRAARAPGAPADYGLVQFGVRNAPKKVLPPIAHEPTTKTGLTHVTGTLSMARGAPGTASGDFFIVLGDMTTLDADPKASGDNLGFAAFGRVVEGLDVVRKFLAAPISTAANVDFPGQTLAAPVVITSARRAP
jgi:peptidyl-prolyl cis-trans isomerase A (cyclophilin A)